MKKMLGAAIALFVTGVTMIGYGVVETAHSGVWQWSTSPATNASADPNINWREGQAPSSINDSARSMMAQLAFWRDSFSGALTTGGTSTAYTLTTNLSLAATPNNGQFLCFVPNVTNGAAPVLSADGGTSFPIQTAPGAAVPSGTLVQGTPYCVSFNSGSSAWVLFATYANPFNVPLGTVLDYTGATAPNSSFVLAFGQAISRTTYANYFALVGTTFGTGDGVTTFNVADLRGRSIHGLDNMGGVAAGRIGSVVTDSGTIAGTTLGSAGGSSTHAQTLTELANHNHTATSTPTDPGHHHQIYGGGVQDNSGSRPLFNSTTGFSIGGNASGGSGISAGYVDNNGASGTPPNQQYIQTSTTGITVATTNTAAGSSAAMALMPPTMMLTKIIRVQHHDQSLMIEMLGAANDNSEFWFPKQMIVGE